jgi:hypothetical protein
MSSHTFGRSCLAKKKGGYLASLSSAISSAINYFVSPSTEAKPSKPMPQQQAIASVSTETVQKQEKETKEKPQVSKLEMSGQREQFEQLVRLQTLKGFWLLDDQLAHVLQLNLHSTMPKLVLRNRSVCISLSLHCQLNHYVWICKQGKESIRKVGKLWATTVVLAYLQAHLAKFKDEWMLLAKKARASVDNVWARHTVVCEDVDRTLFERKAASLF